MLKRGVWVTPLITLLCLHSCLGKPTLGESEHIVQFKKKVLQHLKYDRPPDVSRFNRTQIDQVKLNKMIAKMNQRNSNSELSTKIFKNTDCGLHGEANSLEKNTHSYIVNFQITSKTLLKHRVFNAQLSLPKNILSSATGSLYLYHLTQNRNSTYSQQLITEESEFNHSDMIEFDISDFLRKGSAKVSHMFLISTVKGNISDIDSQMCVPNDSAKLTLTAMPKLSRNKRALNPIDCEKSDQEKKCCRYKIHISFKKIGWDDWVLAPEGYDAHYCAGSCPHRYKMAHTFAGIKSMLHIMNPSLAPKPHCTATKLGPLTLIHLDENGEMTYTDYPDMVVQECKCS